MISIFGVNFFDFKLNLSDHIVTHHQITHSSGMLLMFLKCLEDVSILFQHFPEKAIREK